MRYGVAKIKDSTSLGGCERGFTILENLIAISLLGIVLASSSRMIISSMHANQSARSYAAVVSNVQKLIDGYRALTYSQLLDKFGSDHSSIDNNQAATETSSSTNARATFTTTFTAIKTSSTAFPEAVKVSIAAKQRRGKFGDTTFTFQTIIAQTK